jgi:hypothetical protein
MSESEGRGNQGLSKRFDPRFSPAFQPGYDPRVHREAPPSVPLREEPRRDWPETRRDVPEALVDETGSSEFSIFAIPEESADEPVLTVDEDAEPTPWWRRINPWFIVLWALGIAIVLLAFQLANAVFDTAFLQGQNNGNLGYFVSMLPQMVIFGLPSLICLGLATFVTPFVILAARWRRP